MPCWYESFRKWRVCVNSYFFSTSGEEEYQWRQNPFKSIVSPHWLKNWLRPYRKRFYCSFGCQHDRCWATFCFVSIRVLHIGLIFHRSSLENESLLDSSHCWKEAWSSLLWLGCSRCSSTVIESKRVIVLVFFQKVRDGYRPFLIAWPSSLDFLLLL